MTRETTEKCLATHNAHALRAAAIRLARERAGQDADPTVAYGCVDWFRYDVTSPPNQTRSSGHSTESAVSSPDLQVNPEGLAPAQAPRPSPS